MTVSTDLHLNFSLSRHDNLFPSLLFQWIELSYFEPLKMVQLNQGFDLLSPFDYNSMYVVRICVCF